MLLNWVQGLGVQASKLGVWASNWMYLLLKASKLGVWASKLLTQTSYIPKPLLADYIWESWTLTMNMIIL